MTRNTGRSPPKPEKSRRSESPPRMTVHGHDEVVIISAEESRRLKEDLTGSSLIAAMEASPHREIEIEPRRMPTRVHKVSRRS